MSGGSIFDLSLLTFIFVTLAYYIYKFVYYKKFFNIDNSSDFNESYSKNRNRLYIFIVSVLMAIFNFLSLKNACGGNMLNNIGTYISSLVPIFVVFILVIQFITFLPGWKAPFSNTFGYLITKLMGLSRVYQSLLKDPKDQSDKIKQLLETAISDKSILINEFTPLNMNKQLKELGGLFKLNDIAKINNFKKLIILKDYVSEFIWYVLSGVLTIFISANTISQATCSAELSKEGSKLKE